MPDIKDRIDDYNDTIQALLGFANLYRYDDENCRMRDDVVVFQGRRLTPSPAKAKAEGAFVTPDLGIHHVPGRHLLGEAKKSFPASRDLWAEVFEQLAAYDDNLTGWPCPGGTVALHDIVLLAHISRAPAVRDYCNQRMESGEIQFERPFAIIAFSRSDERNPYYHFEKRLGRISDQPLDARLHEGIPVPMRVLIELYSTVVLYDARPPLPYMAFLIWQHVLAPRASDSPAFKRLRKNQKLDIVIQLQDIVDELRGGFSFARFCPDAERQPEIPKREWCVGACEALVQAKMAAWVDLPARTTIRFRFQKLDNVLDYMCQICPDDQAGGDQLVLFEEGGG